MTQSPGSIALLGSGETSLAGGRIFEALAAQLGAPLRVAILETPAGFELNASQVAGRVADYLKIRLGNFKPVIDVVPARKKGSAFSPDDPEILAPLLQANLIFMGPGSPTYTIRQLQDSLAWELIRARHRLGAALVFASAATIAIGAWGVPVYEIYKVGQDVHTVPGLDLFKSFGLPISCVPHWNNTDGGADVDTSRCFLGMERFAEWCAQLPSENTTLGLDEHTGVILDFQKRQGIISGVSSVSLVRECNPKIYPSGSSFSFDELGLGSLAPLGDIRPDAWQMATSVSLPEEVLDAPSPELVSLAEQREAARKAKDWSRADSLRHQIQAAGWIVTDTPEGPRLSRA
ncbi:MAG: cysteinyl-tRNA synthetase [Chloroflexi bacterium HGW-Chloroflexi-6]|nr:MAG: cysteinyl-tRNA synthetase [Chloroflexi bacterium HGW-Chloroflexi-6]